MDDNPQIVLHVQKPLKNNSFDVKWLPHSTTLVLMGSRASDAGNLQILKLEGSELKELCNTVFANSLKCGTFCASDISSWHLAVGDICGFLQIVDLSRPEMPLSKEKAHTNMINSIDGVGGLGIGKGPAEIVTGGSDSHVNVWDPRKLNSPVVKIVPQSGSVRPDCWAVAAGNAYNSSERVVAAGFDNGDIKIFDLRTHKVMWEANICSGICFLEFDRRDIGMNKLIAATLAAKFHIFDVKTLNFQNECPCITVNAHNSTVCSVRHLPQNKDVWMTTGGNGTLNLWQYQYSDHHTGTYSTSLNMAQGEVKCLQKLTTSSQPITSFDWNAAKRGLAAFTSFDLMLRIATVTRLNTL